MTIIDSDILKIVSVLFPDYRVARLVINDIERLHAIHKERGETFSPRLQAAVLKFSNGSITKFEEALKITELDWRDILLCAGFEKDIHEHQKWINEQMKKLLEE